MTLWEVIAFTKLLNLISWRMLIWLIGCMKVSYLGKEFALCKWLPSILLPAAFPFLALLDIVAAIFMNHVPVSTTEDPKQLCGFYRPVALHFFLSVGETKCVCLVSWLTNLITAVHLSHGGIKNPRRVPSCTKRLLPSHFFAATADLPSPFYSSSIPTTILTSTACVVRALFFYRLIAINRPGHLSALLHVW